MAKYYGLPIRFSDVFNKKELNRVDEFDSIGFNIRLILRSQFGDNRFDSSYGCEVWEKDFEVIDNNSTWSEELARSIKEVLTNHEKRMKEVRVSVKVGEEEFKSGNADSLIYRVKRKIEVKIGFNFYLTGVYMEYVEKLYISPLSIEGV